jgi:Tol biopolymer transport system component
MTSLKHFSFLFLVFAISTASIAQNNANELKYNPFENPPDNIPKIFAKGFVSVADRYEYGLAVSPNFDEIFFTVEDPGDGLMVTNKLGDGTWSNPRVANLRKNNSWEQEAFYTVDGKMLYFASSDEGGTNLWRSYNEGNSWSSAEVLESPVNNPKRVFWATFTQNHTMYYSNVDERRTYRSEMVNGEYPTTEIASIPFGLHASVSKDESFILFNHRGDIYVAFRNTENKWGEPIKLDTSISSTEFGESCPCLSPDEKYIFFSRYNDTNDKSDIYWVSSSILENYEKR